MIALDFRRPVADSRAYVCNGYGNWYAIRPGVYNYHPSIDVVFQEGSIDGAPIQSVAWAEVTYAARCTQPGFEVWGDLIVTRSTLPDGQVVYCRYAHHKNMTVKVGDIIYPGQHIADVSDAYHQYAPHLDFSISKTSILATQPWHWPGANLQAVYDHYYDPCSFIKEHSLMGNDYTALDAALNNLQAAAADMQRAVEAFEAPPEPLPGRVMYTTTNLNVRTAPITGAIVATLLKGDSVRVIDVDPAPWEQIVTGPYTGRFCSGTYLSPNP